MRRASASRLALDHLSPLRGLCRQSLQTRRHIQQRASIVVRRLPDLPFGWILRLSIWPDHLINAVKVGVNLVLSDEPPLFLKRIEVLGCFLAIFLMHQQKGIESLELHPPFLALVFRLAECCPFFVKATHVG